VDVQVVGAAEIAEMLGGLSRQRISQLTTEEDFPPPMQRLRMGNVWRYADVVAWAERTGRSVHPITPR
jgi:predicted DNA-binding transcriptional regulator AlpA